MLSPTVWQVAHALLTRPPLIRPRRDFTVRLECVMHAASVHPEPGSNSLKNCISTGFPRIDPNLLDVRSFALITQSFFKFKRIFGVFVHRCCSIFNEPTAASLAAPRSVTACLFYHSQELLSTPFQNFFKVFSAACLRRIPPRDSSRILSHQTSIVNPFFPFFLSFDVVFINPVFFSCLLCRFFTNAAPPNPSEAFFQSRLAFSVRLYYNMIDFFNIIGF